MGVKGNPDIIAIIGLKILQRYGNIMRMPEGRITKLILDLVQEERRKRERPRNTWMEVVQAAMTARNLKQDP
jgi:hypothetical protein